MYNLELRDQIVFLRVDFNVPLDDEGRVTDTTRIDRSIPTILHILNQGAGVLLVSHMGRPKGVMSQWSLKPVLEHLSQQLSKSVKWLPQWPRIPHQLQPGEVALGENTRFNEGELENDAKLAKQMARGCDAFIFDAFACAHRLHASTVGVMKYIDHIGVGSLVKKELHQLNYLLSSEAYPLATIVSGAKVQTKLPLLKRLLTLSHTCAVGGVIANTLLKAKGYEIGQSKFDEIDADDANQLLACQHLLLPVDVVVKQGNNIRTTSVDAVQKEDVILDLGPDSIEQIGCYLSGARTVFWNGPVGYFEQPEFAKGSIALAEKIMGKGLYTIVGGGDTLAVFNSTHIDGHWIHPSTGGGASLTYLSDAKLEVLEAISNKTGECYVSPE